MIEIDQLLNFFVLAVITLLAAAAAVYVLAFSDNQSRLQPDVREPHLGARRRGDKTNTVRAATDPHQNRIELLDQIKDLENNLSVIREEKDFSDFWDEFILRFPEIDKDIKFHKERLGEKRPIVVVGETSSGKSSFLNLMLGLPLLPVDHQHATAGIIKIQKSKSLAVVPKGGSPKTPIDSRINENEEDAAEFVRDALQDIVTSEKKGADEKEKTKATEVEIHWPFENYLLEDDITIVDTPGYGETEDMKELLIGYLNKAVGFLYIVNAGNAGGIQADRLKKIIKDQHDYCDKNNVELVDPKRALFFFNKWDQIQSGNQYDFSRDKKTKRSTNEEAQQKVWNTNIEKLKATWSDFKPDQAMKFSVAKAMTWVDRCIGVDEDQEDIARTKIKSVVEDSLNNGLDPTKRWLTSVNSFIEGTINKHLSTAHATKSEKENLLEKYQSKTSHVNAERHEKERNIRQHIKDETRAFAAVLERHIKSSRVKDKMQNWCYGDFPCSLFNSPDTIKRETTQVVLHKLSSIMQRDMKNETEEFSRNLATYIQGETNRIQELVKEIDLIIESTPLKLKITINDVTTVCGSFVHSDMLAINWLALNFMGVGWILGFIASEIFFVLFIVALPFLFLTSLLTGCSPHVKILQKTSLEIIETVDVDMLYNGISEKLKKLQDKVNVFFNEVTKNMNSLEKQFVHICSSTENPEDIIDRYTKLSKRLAPYLQKCENVCKSPNEYCEIIYSRSQLIVNAIVDNCSSFYIRNKIIKQ